MNKTTEIFEKSRPVLFRLAYRMLGRIAPAEDAVQEAFLRWQKLETEQIQNPQAYLSTVVSRICLDEIKSAKNRREQYIGPDLPEPILVAKNNSPEDNVELAESLSMAMHVVLQQLTPMQRAVFILREIFDYDYSSIAEITEKSEAHCRKIAQRARERIRDGKPTFQQITKAQQKLVSTFLDAVQERNLAKIEQLLAQDAVMYSDGGGKVTAARKPVKSAHKIAKFLLGIQKQVPQSTEWQIEFTTINGEPGIVLWLNGELYNAWSFHIEDNTIQSIYVVLNPDKLKRLKEQWTRSKG